MTATVRFRGRRKPACSQRTATADIECEADIEGARALHIRKLQMIRRQLCNAAVEEPVPVQEPKRTNFLSQNFKRTENQISPATQHLERPGLKRVSEPGEQSIPGKPIDWKRSKTVPSEADHDVQEYDLSIEDKLKNIKATEAATQAAKKKFSISASFLDGQEGQILKMIPSNIGCNFQQYENEQAFKNVRYGASDEFVFQQFRKRVS